MQYRFAVNFGTLREYAGIVVVRLARYANWLQILFQKLKKTSWTYSSGFWRRFTDATGGRIPCNEIK